MGELERLLAARLAALVQGVCGDVLERRKLRYEPAKTLASYGLAAPSALPRELPIRHLEISVNITMPALFGGVWQPGPAYPDCDHALWLVLARAKPVALIHGTPSLLETVARDARATGLHVIFSPHEYDVYSEPGLGAYHNLTRNIRPAVAESPAHKSMLVGSDINQLALAWLAQLFGWDTVLGHELGYPSCCTRAFVEHWPAARAQHSGDMALLAVKESDPGTLLPWETNQLARYMGWSVLHHFPCRPDCDASIRLARRYIEGFRQHAPNHLAGLATHLSAPAIYSEDSGVILLPGAEVRAEGGDWLLAYDADAFSMSATNSPAASILGRSAEVRFTSCEQRFEVPGGDVFGGHLLRFSQFPAEELAQ